MGTAVAEGTFRRVDSRQTAFGLNSCFNSTFRFARSLRVVRRSIARSDRSPRLLGIKV
jgi:hypothetical protein